MSTVVTSGVACSIHLSASALTLMSAMHGVDSSAWQEGSALEESTDTKVRPTGLGSPRLPIRMWTLA